MMRTGALPLLLFLAACGDSGGNRADGEGNLAVPAAPDNQRNAAATLALAASGPGGCSGRWNGQPATPAQVVERSSALIERAISQAGSVENLTEEVTPTIAVTAPASLGFGCVDSFLAAINRAAVPSVLLTPDGGQAAALADFTLSEIGAPPPSVVIAVGGGGVLTWNGRALTLAALGERIRQLGSATEIEGPPGELEVRPAREANFGQVHAVLRAIRAGHVRAALLLPSVTPVRPSTAPLPEPPANGATTENLVAPQP